MAVDLALQKISEALGHLDKMAEYEQKGINGARKLRKRIQAEINFLNKGLQNTKDLKEKDVQCSNLGQLGALSEVAMEIPDVTGILQPFKTEDDVKIVVDVVGKNRMEWTKVIMRNPKALHMVFMLGGKDGSKPLDEVAEEFMICAELHPVFFSPPNVVFWFRNGVSESLAKSIEGKGVEVKGQRIPDLDLGLPDFSTLDSDTETEDSSSASHCSSLLEEGIFVELCDDSQARIERKENTSIGHISFAEPDRSDIALNLNSNDECSFSSREATDSGFCDESCDSSKEAVPHDCCVEGGKLHQINLDVTAMIAYVSATANGGANFIFQDKFLNEQAACERQNPVKATLDGYFAGHELLACREAVDRFQEIVNVIAGEGEKARASKLLARLRIVPGQDYFKDKLKRGGKIRELPRIAFGTGQALKAITVTSNMGFVRAAESQGVKLAVLIHKPRALTEAKECCASPIEEI